MSKQISSRMSLSHNVITSTFHHDMFMVTRPKDMRFNGLGLADRKRKAWSAIGAESRKSLRLTDLEILALADHIGSESAKVLKGNKMGYFTHIVYMSAADRGPDGVNLCPNSTYACRFFCLGHTSGRMPMTQAQRAQALRRAAYIRDIEGWMTALVISIDKALIRCRAKGYELAVRVNGTTDLDIRRLRKLNGHNVLDVFAADADAHFYDYTKSVSACRDTSYPNYHLTFSLSEENAEDAKSLLDNGLRNVAVIFRTAEFPQVFMGHTVISGDEDDLRFLDDAKTLQAAVVVGLKAKGKLARNDKTGMVQDA